MREPALLPPPGLSDAKLHSSKSETRPGRSLRLKLSRSHFGLADELQGSVVACATPESAGYAKPPRLQYVPCLTSRVPRSSGFKAALKLPVVKNELFLLPIHHRPVLL